MKQILLRLAEYAAQDPARPALKAVGQSLSYGELWQQIQATAEQLRLW